MKNKIYVIFFLAFYLGSNVFAQSASWTFYDTTNTAAPVNFITVITVDKTNNKWFGTNYGGLIKYDGTNWTVFNQSNSPLPSDYIGSIVVDSNNHLWIGTFDGLAYFDGINWKVYNSSSTPSLPGVITALTIDNTGNIWCYTWSCAQPALVRIQDTTLTFYNTSNSEIPQAWIRDIKVDSNNILWMAAYDKGLIKYDGLTWTVYNPENSGIPDSLAQCIKIAKNGDVWVGMYRGVAKFNGSNWTVYNHWEATTIEEAPNGDIWVGYDGSGLQKFNGTAWFNYLTYNSALPDNYIADVHIDDDNSVWIGTDFEGIAVLRENITGIGNSSTLLNSAIFPNPFSTQLTFSLADNAQTTVSLYNFLGQQVLQQTFTNSTTINTAQLVDGIYFYELRNDKRTLKTGKLVKQ